MGERNIEKKIGEEIFSKLERTKILGNEMLPVLAIERSRLRGYRTTKMDYSFNKPINKNFI